MLTATLCLALLTAAPPEPIQVAVPSLGLVNLDPKLADFYTGHLAQQLSFQGVRTVSATELAALLGFDRQRQLMGCSSDSCKAEISKSLGVDGLLVGSVTKIDRTFRLDVRVVSPRDGRPLAGASASSDDNDRLVGTFIIVAEQLAQQLAKSLGRTLADKSAVEIVRGPSQVKRLFWIPAAAGGVAAITGGIFMLQAKGSYDRLTVKRNEPLTEAQADEVAAAGRTQQTVGWVGVGVGVAALAGAAGMYLLGGDEVVRAGVAVTPGGVSIGVAGVLP